MNSTKDIWCPDCNQNLITKQELGMRGKCVSCYRREVASKRFDKPYVKFIDLPIEERQEIIYRRATIKSKRKIEKPNKVNPFKKEAENKVSKYDNNKELHTYIKNHPEMSYNKIAMYAYKNIPGCEELSGSAVRKIVIDNNYDHINNASSKQNKILKDTLNNKILKLFSGDDISKYTSAEIYDRCVSELDYKGDIKSFRTALINSKIPYKRVRKNYSVTTITASTNNTNHRSGVYTEDIIEVLNTFCTQEMTLREIYDALISMFPNSGITPDNLCHRLKFLKIPYRKLTSQERAAALAKARSARRIKSKSSGESIKDDKIDNISTGNLELNDINKNYIKQDIKITSSGNQVDRFEPIKQEIKQVLDRKYRQLGCEIERNYTIDDYINFLDMWSYLSVHCNNLIRIRNDQHDIMNAYQNDIIHEMENVVAEPGDTYLQDKLHIMRNERRYYEYDKNDLTTLQPLFETSDNVKILEIKQRLENIRDKRQNPIYIPVVDTGMIDKYNWSIARNIGKP